MKLTIAGLLSHESLRELRLVGGAEESLREVRDLSFMDNPDSVRFLKEGELLLTTGYAIKDDPVLQEKLIMEMAELGCSGLAIKIKRYFDHIPKRMIELADEHKLPLIEIPNEYSLSSIAGFVYKEILNKQAYYLQKSEEIHHKLIKVALRAGSLIEILHSVGNMISNPLIVLDSNWRLLGYSDNENNTLPLEEHLVLKKGQLVFPPAFFKDVQKEINDWDKAEQKEYMISGRTVVCKIYPIAANGTIYGYMVVLECIKKLNKIDYITIEHAGTIIALERIKAKAIEETKHHIRSDFFDDLLCGKIESVNAVKSLSEINGLDVTKRYACMAVKVEYNDLLDVSKGKIEEKERRDIKIEVRDEAERIAFQYNRNLISIFRGNQVILLLQVEDSDDKFVSLKEFCINFSKELLEAASKKIYYYQIRIGIGKVYPNILEIHHSFKEAIEAIVLGKKLEKGQVVHFEDLFIYHALETMMKKDAKTEFVRNTIQKLYEYDTENNSNLVTTLETYYDCNCNVTEAAKKQFMHRNTIKYRLEKIREILNKDIDHPEISLELNIGIKLLHLMGQNEAKVVEWNTKMN